MCSIVVHVGHVRSDSDDTTFNKRTWSHNISASWLSAASLTHFKESVSELNSLHMRLHWIFNCLHGDNFSSLYLTDVSVGMSENMCWWQYPPSPLSCTNTDKDVRNHHSALQCSQWELLWRMALSQWVQKHYFY